MLKLNRMNGGISWLARVRAAVKPNADPKRKAITRSDYKWVYLIN